jgi:hypothetical protein
MSPWTSYVDSLTWAKHHLDNSSWYAFLRAGSLRIAPEEAVKEVAQRIEAAGDHPKAGKLQRQIRRAYAYAGAHAGEIHHKAPAKPVYQPQRLERVAQNIDYDVTPDWLAQRSLYTTWNRTPAGFLHKLYQPDENVVVFDDYYNQGREVWKHPGIIGDLSSLDHLQEGCPDVWFLANPVDGKYYWNPRQQKQSRRSEEAVTSWRYLVIESDQAPTAHWLRALVQLPLPIVAIYSSGGKSIHSLVRIDAESKAHWDAIVRGHLLPILVPLGACDGSLTAVRLTRLPNCRRGKTGNMQTLLYLNPTADYTPIAHRPLRKHMEEYGIA